jgi:hypothetical protein
MGRLLLGAFAEVPGENTGLRGIEFADVCDPYIPTALQNPVPVASQKDETEQ